MFDRSAPFCHSSTAVTGSPIGFEPQLYTELGAKPAARTDAETLASIIEDLRDLLEKHHDSATLSIGLLAVSVTEAQGRTDASTGTGDRPLVVSIDWDYFMPLSPHGFGLPWDTKGLPEYGPLQWQASAFKRPWRRNIGRNSPYKLVKVETSWFDVFLRQVLADGARFDLRVCESHEQVVEFTDDLDAFDMINFDAHHDIKYWRDYPLGELNCGNWAGHLRAQGRLKFYSLVYPKWRYKHPEHEAAWLPKGIDQVFYGDWPGAPTTPTKVFVCRSSTWMPSWCDPEWLKLIERLKARSPRSTDIDPIVLRTRPFDLAEAAEQGVYASVIRSLGELNPHLRIPSLADLSEKSMRLLALIADPSKAKEARLEASTLHDALLNYATWEYTTYGEPEWN
jgi:hypothetical protein